jgi:hypothetical protein
MMFTKEWRERVALVSLLCAAALMAYHVYGWVSINPIAMELVVTTTLILVSVFAAFIVFQGMREDKPRKT